MKRRFFIFTTLYFATHIVLLCCANADDLVAPADIAVAQEVQQSHENKELPVIAAGADNNNNVSHNNLQIETQRRWNIAGYAFIGYGMSFAQPLDISGIAYSTLLRKLQYGFIVGGGVLLNDIYGLGLSFINVRGVDRVSDNNAYFRSIQNAYYMVNFDVSLTLPIRLFKGRLQFYVIGGVTGIFTDINHRLKDGVNINNPGIKFSFAGNIGGGIEVFMNRKLSARFEGRYMFVPTSAPISDFFMMQIMLMLRI